MFFGSLTAPDLQHDRLSGVVVAVADHLGMSSERVAWLLSKPVEFNIERSAEGRVTYIVAGRTRLAAGFTRRKVSRSTRTRSPSFPFLTCTAMGSCISLGFLALSLNHSPRSSLDSASLTPLGCVYTPNELHLSGSSGHRLPLLASPDYIILSLFPRPYKYEKPTSRPATPFLASPTWSYIPSFRRVLVLCTVFQRSSTCTLRRTPFRIGR